MQLLLSSLSIAIALTTGVAAFIYYRKSRKYMELSYEISPILSLVSIQTPVKDRVQIKYGDEQIEDLEGVIVKLRNSGTLGVEYSSPANAQDISTQTPVTIDLGQDTRILGEPAVDTTPKGLNVSARTDPHNPGRVILDRFLLNPGDIVATSIFATDFTGRPSVYGHIRDTTLREHRGERLQFSNLVRSLAFVGFLSLYLLFGMLLWWLLELYVNPHTAAERKDVVQAVVILMAGVAASVGIYLVWRNLQARG